MFRKEVKPDSRYASFDYCYKYFKETEPDDLARQMEKSCLMIAFYLASWGMLRGSSSLLRKSAKYYEPLVLYIAAADKTMWEVDVDSYSDENIERLTSLYNDLKKLVTGGSSHLTLVTKIMLGVFGVVPAFDNYFTATMRSAFHGRCGFRSFNSTALLCIAEFYDANHEEIDRLASESRLLCFDTGEPTSTTYTRAKIIDMYGFQKSISGRHTIVDN